MLSLEMLSVTKVNSVAKAYACNVPQAVKSRVSKFSTLGMCTRIMLQVIWISINFKSYAQKLGKNRIPFSLLLKISVLIMDVIVNVLIIFSKI